MSKLFSWDGRTPFYPNVGYEKDKEFMNRHNKYLACKDIPLENGDSKDEGLKWESDRSSEEEIDGVTKVAHGLSKQLVNLPPLYDHSDHYHPMRRNDWQISMLGKCIQNKTGESMLDILPRRM